MIELTSNEVVDDFLTSLPQGNFFLPANPAHIAEFRYKVNLEHLTDFLKFTAWEAIDTIPENSNGVERRAKALQSYVEDMKSKQEMGLVQRS